MPPSQERTPREKETLIFATPEQAQQFQENVATKMEQKQPGVVRRREVVAEAVADEFAQHGTPVDVVREPWLHSQPEHEEVQTLVDVAFTKDLPAAIKQARLSPHYPRNLDLLHDVLTNELYKLAQEHQVNKQPLAAWVLTAIAIIVVGLLAVLLVILFSQ